MQTQWPVRVGVVPRAADCFQNRAQAAELEWPPTGGDTQARCQVLTGMGGVGKTQLAAWQARQMLAAGDVEVRVWVTAVSRQAVIDAYVRAAAMILHADPEDGETAAHRFLEWLETVAVPRPARWLVVLDDLSDPADLTGLWPPDSPHGRTLVTTRARDAALTGRERRLVPVGLFTAAEATGYLAASLAHHGRTEPEGELAALAEELGCLPLALSQAAAYLIDAGMSSTEYRGRLRDRARSMADHQPATLPDDQTHGVAAAWSLSLDRADALPPAGVARRLIQLSAMLDSNGIPQAVLTSDPAFLADPAGTRQAAPVPAEDAEAALRVLHRLNLVDHTLETPHTAVRVHQLIQRAVRETLTRRQREDLAQACADALLAVWPDIERDTAYAQALRANTIVLTVGGREGLDHLGTQQVLIRSGRSLAESGQVTASCEYFQQLIISLTAALGPGHPQVLTARFSLGHWTGRAGDIAGAVSEFAVLLPDMIHVLGPQHPDTLAARANLEYWRSRTGGVEEAVAAFQDRSVGTNRPPRSSSSLPCGRRSSLTSHGPTSSQLSSAASSRARERTAGPRVTGGRRSRRRCAVRRRCRPAWSRPRSGRSRRAGRRRGIRCPGGPGARATGTRERGPQVQGGRAAECRTRRSACAVGRP
ncbi:hypothetical protein AQJ46_45895 [Streptomyces canus]|uniref:Uncharacterized protein n=1 Tax=Streptomyces canus TaxID=58343 RepID=A0A101RLJ9_9ACTN|nr:NB-ARC domain-containing protein [Streptomyces canus]KUN57753.1 hypothetical protein AQJ46_45895 [Streptomyces canus]